MLNRHLIEYINPLKIRVYYMRYSKMSKNYCFRKFECDLSKVEAAEFCFRSLSTVKEWDKGKGIPKACRRLMRMHKCRTLHCSGEWEGFEMVGDKLKTPVGKHVTPRERLTGLVLVEIQSELEIKTSSYLLKTARSISKML